MNFVHLVFFNDYLRMRIIHWSLDFNDFSITDNPNGHVIFDELRHSVFLLGLELCASALGGLQTISKLHDFHKHHNFETPPLHFQLSTNAHLTNTYHNIKYVNTITISAHQL